MSWLNKVGPILLHQSSDVPYIILADGVKLCIDNLYSKHKDNDSYNISFTIPQNQVKAQSTNYYKIKKFPTTIQFNDIIRLDDTIINGKLIKSNMKHSNIDESNIAISNSNYVDNINDAEFQILADQLENFDKSFILVGDDEIGTQTRILSNVSSLIYHSNWLRSVIKIAESISKNPKKYGWTNSLPIVSISCFGFTNTDDMDALQSAISETGISSFSVQWED